MDYLKIGQQINIKRSDGRIQPVMIAAKNSINDTITTEWMESGNSKGKEVAMSIVMALNTHIFERNADTVSTAPSVDNKSKPGETYRNPYPTKKILADKAKSNVKNNKNSPYQVTKTNKDNKLISNPPSKMIASENMTSMSTTTGSDLKSIKKPPRLTSGFVSKKTPASLRYNGPCSTVVKEVARIKNNREHRRAVQAEQREQITQQMNRSSEWDWVQMMQAYRNKLIMKPLRSLDPRAKQAQQITVCVRKRPLNRREIAEHCMDILTIPTKDSLIVHEMREKVDMTKYLDHHRFRFDYTFDENCSNSLVFEHTARPLIRTMFDGGNATCFAYGQTGSGKTHTMGGKFHGKVQDCSTGIYALAAAEIFAELTKPVYKSRDAKVTCSFFEIYGPKVIDLLSPKKMTLRVLEDGKQQVRVVGLTEMTVSNVEGVLKLIEQGSRERTSGHTSANAKSSRSHAVFQICLYLGGTWTPHGKCSFIDLAGNERGADTQGDNRHMRIEGAEINKALLALKECIRALSRHSTHLPFRGSKLTQVLRDSFIGGVKNKTCMIAMISPGQNSVEHTLNTLRYADRVKELIPNDNANSNLDDFIIYGDERDDIINLTTVDLTNESEPELLSDPLKDCDDIELINESFGSDQCRETPTFNDSAKFSEIDESCDKFNSDFSPVPCASPNQTIHSYKNIEDALDLSQVLKKYRSLNTLMMTYKEHLEAFNHNDASLDSIPDVLDYMNDLNQYFLELATNLHETRHITNLFINKHASDYGKTTATSKVHEHDK